MHLTQCTSMEHIDDTLEVPISRPDLRSRSNQRCVAATYEEKEESKKEENEESCKRSSRRVEVGTRVLPNIHLELKVKGKKKKQLN